jgi:hypothetical protein
MAMEPSQRAEGNLVGNTHIMECLIGSRASLTARPPRAKPRSLDELAPVVYATSFSPVSFVPG